MAARGDVSSSGGSGDADDGDAAGGAGRSYRITVRDWEVFRYTLPDFFPDFNETPLEARMNAGADTGMSTAGTEGRTRKDAREGGGGGTRKSYVWKRGVLAGTERSDPLEVIAKDRERFEERLRGEGREGSMDEGGGAEGGAVEIGVDGAETGDPSAAGIRGQTRGGIRRRDQDARGADAVLLSHRAGGDVVEGHTGRRAAGAGAGDGTRVGGASAAGVDRRDRGG